VVGHSGGALPRGQFVTILLLPAEHRNTRKRSVLNSEVYKVQ
jgi:hypothetical protein